MSQPLGSVALTVPPRIEVRNPANGELLGSVPVASQDDVKRAVERAREAQRAWGARSIRERADVLERVQHVLIGRSQDVVQALVREVGRPPMEALSLEVGNHIALLAYFTGRAERFLRPERLTPWVYLHQRSYLHFPPRGVIGVISPWNFPFALAMGPVAMALLAGNGVVAKPSEFTPLVQDLAREIYLEAGVPEDLFQVVHGAGDTGRAVVEGGVDMVVFTGSRATGKKVAAACGERLIPCVTELGGKGPALVLPDADLERTAQALVWGAFANCGQVCASVERALVHASVLPSLLPALVRRTEALRVGDASKPGANCDLGPLQNQRQLRIVEALVEDAVRSGAKVETGGRRLDGPGHFYAPTILSGVTPQMRIATEETFGPVLAVMTMESEAAMLAEANRVDLGLLAYVFTRDKAHGRALAERIEAGTVMLNDVIVTAGFPETPWGGVKQSGVGHTHTKEGLRSLCQQRHVRYQLNELLTPELWWFPYTAERRAVLESIIGPFYARTLGDRFRKVSATKP